MRRGYVIALFLLIVVITSVFVFGAENEELEEDSCGFFCKFVKTLKNILGIEDNSVQEVVSDDGESEAKISSESEESLEDVKQKEQKTESQKKKEAIEKQVNITVERAVKSVLANIDVQNPECEISSNKEEITGNGKITFETKFLSNEFKYEKVLVACDQFERFGTSADKSYPEVVPGSLKIKTECDWGGVTVPTIYFFIVYNDDVNYCAKAITVLPSESDLNNLGEDGCFKEEVLNDMKKVCEDKGLRQFSIPDENNCESVYCGGENFTLCTPEPLLEKASLECESQGPNFKANKYSEWFDGQDWPCAQIRCSECPSEEDLEQERELCRSKGDGWEPRTDTDWETTGCPIILCDEPESSEENNFEIEDGPPA